MAELTPEEQQELQNFVQEHFTQEDIATITALIAMWLKVDIRGLTLKEGMRKVEQAIHNMDTNEVNQKIVDVLMENMKANKQSASTGREGERTEANISVNSRPRKLISPNTKVSNKLFGHNNSRYYDAMRWLSVEGDQSKKELSVSLFVKYDESIDTGLHISIPYENRMLVSFDRIVHDAVVAHVLNGNEYITTNMIYQVISGNEEGKASQNPVPKSLSVAISESITRLYQSWVEIDATEQAKAYGFEKGFYKGHLLSGSITEGVINGNVTTCAHISETPILYQYANNCKQVIRYDVKMLNVPALENSPEWIVLKTYLLQQIKIMEHTKNFNRTICFDTLYELLDVDAPSEAALRMKRKQVRDSVIKCLNFWTAQKLIRGYELNRQGKGIVSVTLKVKVKALPAKR